MVQMQLPGRSITTLFLICCAARTSLASPYPPAPAPDIHLPHLSAKDPDITYTLPSGRVIHDAAFTFNGKNVLMIVETELVPSNLLLNWALADLVRLVVGLAVLLSVCGVVRKLRQLKMTEPGGRYCSVCNYCLKGTSSRECPECGIVGKVTTGKAIHRQALRRMAVSGLLFFLMMLLLLGPMPHNLLWLKGLGQSPEELAAIVNANERKLFVAQAVRLIEMDPTSGKTVRVWAEEVGPIGNFIPLRTDRGWAMSRHYEPRQFHMAKSGDGSALVADLCFGDWYVDLKNGTAQRVGRLGWEYHYWLAGSSRNQHFVTDENKYKVPFAASMNPNRKTAAPKMNQFPKHVIPVSIPDQGIKTYELFEWAGDFGGSVHRSVMERYDRNGGNRFYVRSAVAPADHNLVYCAAEDVAAIYDLVRRRWVARLNSRTAYWRRYPTHQSYFYDAPTLSSDFDRLLQIDISGKWLSIHDLETDN